MNIIIPAYIINEAVTDVMRIAEQIYVAIESYYYQGNSGTFIIFTNNNTLERLILKFDRVFKRGIVINKIDFEKEWEKLNLSISGTRTRREVIISKLIIPFIFDDAYLMMDWDIMTTGYIDPNVIISNKLRLFNPKLYDGLTLRQNSLSRKLSPENQTIGMFRWLNSGMVYSPKGLAKQLITEYWGKYYNIKEKVYKGIYLYDIISDELIYNIMMLDGDPRIEECSKYNINTTLKNFYYSFSRIDSMYTFGKNHPQLLNVHFAVGHVKPYNVIINDEGNLLFQINVEKYDMDCNSVKWIFDMGEHRMGSYNYNALIFSIIWQHTKYTIRKRLDLDKEDISVRYLEFFNNSFIK
jgi:hypothetical protein